MKHIRLQLFLIYSISFLLLVVTAVVSLSCAGGDWEYEDSVVQFFSPYNLQNKNAEPFFRSWHAFNNTYVDHNIENFTEINAEEWNLFFSSSSPIDDIKALLYQTPKDTLELILAWTKNKTNAAPWDSNQVLKQADPAKLNAFLNYMLLAKTCEPFMTEYNSWYDEQSEEELQQKSDEMNLLIPQAKEKMAAETLPFIRERYIFQVTRLLYKTGRYRDCIDFFAQQKALFKEKTNMYYRSLGYVAGAHYRENEYATANYYYALIYNYCKPMSLIAFQCFHPQEEEDWNTCLNLATNPKEKCMLWHMLGLYADPLRAMQEISKLDASSDLLHILLVRAISINEEQMYSYSEEEPKPSSLPDQALATFIIQTALKQKTTDPALWYMAAGYYSTLLYKYNDANTFLKKAVLLKPSDLMVNDQVRVLIILGRIQMLEQPDAAFEQAIAADLYWLRSGKHPEHSSANDLLGWALVQLSKKYAEQNNSVFAECLLPSTTFYLNQDNQKSMLDWMQKSGHSEFERFLMENYLYAEVDIYEYQATRALYEGNTNEAVTLFRKANKTDTLLADPFIIHNIDCHDCDMLAKQKDKYTKLKVTEKAIQLQQLAEAESNTEKAAQLWFTLANFYYNISYYGNNRFMYQNSINGYDNGYYSSYPNVSETIYSDCSKAMQLYDKAMNLSINKEFKARCCFMAAKCEQNQMYNAGSIVDGEFKVGNYIKLLVSSWKKTSYYKEVIKECGYLALYAEAGRR